MRSLSPLALTFAFGLVAVACSSSNPGGGGAGGSTTGSGGTNNSGGSTGTGGSNGSGGATGSGGSNSSGGSTGSGGVGNTGGTTGTGGTTSTGGATGTGGTTPTGGTTGTGGHAGSNGTGGTTATGGGGSSATGGGGGSATGFYSDDFESDQSGKQPAGWDNLINYNHNTTDPMGSLTAVADGTHTRNSSSKLALHVVSDGTMVFLERPLPSGTNHLFVRVYVYSTNQIGMTAGDNHETLIGITADPTHTQLRFGQMKGSLGFSLASDDNLSPPTAKQNMPPVISPDTWHCIEVEFDGTAAYNTVNAWSDSTLVYSLNQGSDWDHAAEPATWMNGYFGDVQIGWESFSGMKNELWFDDLVLSTTRVGCN